MTLVWWWSVRPCSQCREIISGADLQPVPPTTLILKLGNMAQNFTAYQVKYNMNMVKIRNTVYHFHNKSPQIKRLAFWLCTSHFPGPSALNRHDRLLEREDWLKTTFLCFYASHLQNKILILLQWCLNWMLWPVSAHVSAASPHDGIVYAGVCDVWNVCWV